MRLLTIRENGMGSLTGLEPIRFMTANKTAQIWIDVQALGGYTTISDEDCAQFYDFFMNKYGQKKA